MRHPDAVFTIKYFDLIDQFIKVRSRREDINSDLRIATGASGFNKQAYREAVVQSCVENLDGILKSVKNLDEDYDLDIVHELLYQIVVDVNPSLEIHQFSGGATAASASSLSSAAFTTSGAPSAELLERVTSLAHNLKQDVCCQDRAIDQVAEELLVETKVRLEDAPLGVFLFIGTTGVGKTELAKGLATSLFGDPKSLIRVNGGEYELPHEVAKLIGAPPGYIGHNEGGVLSEGLKKRPESVVLFDEIEKAHRNVYNFLLPYAGEGQFLDNKGNVIDGRRSVLVMTSNVGTDLLERVKNGSMAFSRGDPSKMNAELLDIIMPELRTVFRPEFLGRLRIVPFHSFTREDCLQVTGLKLAGYQKRLAVQGYPVEFDAGLVPAIVPPDYSPDYGARDIKNYLKRVVINPLRLWLARESIEPGQYQALHVHASDKDLVVRLKRSGRWLRRPVVLVPKFRPLKVDDGAQTHTSPVRTSKQAGGASSANA